MNDDMQHVLRELTGDARELRSTVESLQAQTAEQWTQLKDIQQNNIRQATILDRVVRDQRELAEGLRVAANGLAEYRSDRKVFNAFKWLAGFGGAAGLLGGFASALRSFLADRLGG